MATVIVPSSTEPSSSKDVMKKDKKGKKDKKEKKEKKEKHVEMSAETSNLDTEAAETKEERTARKEAKKLVSGLSKLHGSKAEKTQAKAAQTGNTSLTTTKSEVEVDKLLSETAPDKPKADKKKRKHEDTTTEDDQAVKEGVTLGEESEKKKSKKEKKEKKAKGQVAEPETEAASTAPVESQDLSVPPTKKPKKEKKPKLDREKIQAKEDHVDQALRAAEATRETGEGEDSNMTGEDGPSKKRKKNNDGELDSEDIYADEALSDGAKKGGYCASCRPLLELWLMDDTSAIVYASQFTLSQKKAEGSSTPWKFNKAKQNWLIRHIWIEEEVGCEPAAITFTSTNLTTLLRYRRNTSTSR